MGFDQTLTHFKQTATANVTTLKRLKKFPMRRNISPTPCTTNHKVSNA